MHVIRLRGPWQLEPLVQFVAAADGTHRRQTDGLPPAVRAKMPADWGATLGRDFLGVVRYRRTFQKPTGLDRGERVWLVVEPPRSGATVCLNGQPVGDVRHGTAAGRFDITGLLASGNALEIDVEHAVPDEAGGLVGEVRLEIA